MTDKTHKDAAVPIGLIVQIILLIIGYLIRKSGNPGDTMFLRDLKCRTEVIGETFGRKEE